MTHEELLARIKLRRETTKWMNAVFAVVKLHKPVMGDRCEACYREEYFGGRHLEVGKYSCETIQAIEKELA